MFSGQLKVSLKYINVYSGGLVSVKHSLTNPESTPEEVVEGKHDINVSQRKEDEK